MNLHWQEYIAQSMGLGTLWCDIALYVATVAISWSLFLNAKRLLWTNIKKLVSCFVILSPPVRMYRQKTTNKVNHRRE
ncbi:MAG TPA: hypothetical protein DEP57_04325 [Selenomonas sp.]|nr:hypothetical protein [Selenomonas sp.]